MFPLGLNHITLPVLVNHGSFRVKGTKQQAPGELFEFEFHADPSAKLADNNNLIFHYGRVVLDPTKSWLPVEYELQYPDGKRALLFKHSAFRQHQNGMWYPGAIDSQYRNQEGNFVPFRSTSVLSLKIGESNPDSDFTLSAFGLPEPIDETESGAVGGASLWLILVLGALLLLAAGAFFRYRSQNAMPPAP
jgi:hypothetical protein